MAFLFPRLLIPKLDKRNRIFLGMMFMRERSSFQQRS